MRIWFMRDNHTFIEFPVDKKNVKDFVINKEKEEPGFYKYGLLAARDRKDETILSIHIGNIHYQDFVQMVLDFYNNLPKEEPKTEVELLREEVALCRKMLMEKEQIFREFVNKYKS